MKNKKNHFLFKNKTALYSFFINLLIIVFTIFFFVYGSINQWIIFEYYNYNIFNLTEKNISDLTISLCESNNMSKEKTNSSKFEVIKIKQIIENPKKYVNKTLIIYGKFGGWSSKLNCSYDNITMKTRSDMLIYDNTDCIYMTQGVNIIYNESELNPWNEKFIGKKLIVKAKIILINGKPILS